MMSGTQGNLFTRSDTFFGVCQGLGEDLGIPPNLLRIAAALLLFVNAKAVIIGYFAAGVLVFTTRMIFSERRALRRLHRAQAEARPVSAEPVAQPEPILVEELRQAA